MFLKTLELPFLPSQDPRTYPAHELSNYQFFYTVCTIFVQVREKKGTTKLNDCDYFLKGFLNSV